MCHVRKKLERWCPPHTHTSYFDSHWEELYLWLQVEHEDMEAEAMYYELEGRD